jgi:hypothetical protein
MAARTQEASGVWRQEIQSSQGGEERPGNQDERTLIGDHQSADTHIVSEESDEIVKDRAEKAVLQNSLQKEAEIATLKTERD